MTDAKIKYNWSSKDFYAGMRYVSKQYAPHDQNGISKYHNIIGYLYTDDGLKHCIINTQDGLTTTFESYEELAESLNKDDCEAVPEWIFNALDDERAKFNR